MGLEWNDIGIGRRCPSEEQSVPAGSKSSIHWSLDSPRQLMPLLIWYVGLIYLAHLSCWMPSRMKLFFWNRPFMSVYCFSFLTLGKPLAVEESTNCSWGFAYMGHCWVLTGTAPARVSGGGCHVLLVQWVYPVVTTPWGLGNISCVADIIHNSNKIIVIK